jgi:hypothetical protein
LSDYRCNKAVVAVKGAFIGVFHRVRNIPSREGERSVKGFSSIGKTGMFYDGLRLWIINIAIVSC